jgi:hypothetical protein
MMPRISQCIGIVGSRRRNTANDNIKLLVAFDKEYQEGDTLVSGGCPTGGDNMAEYLAKARGLTITIHFPDWIKHGKAAGFVRNSKIAEQCDVLIALVASDRTGGTEDTIKKCQKLGKKVILA